MRVRCKVLPFAVVAGLAVLAGCGGNGGGSTGGSGGGGGGGTPTPAAVVHVYVIQDPATFGSGSGSVLAFPATSSGSVSPSSTLTGPANTSFEFLATDGSGNVYVGGDGLSSEGEILEYSAGASGAATPVRTLPGDMTTLIGAVQGLSVSAAGEIFVSKDSGGVEAFSATANGSVAPSRYILGASETGGGMSTLISANDVAADASDNLYVVNEGAPGLAPIVVFGPTATGDVAPIRTIGGATTTIGSVSGLTTDSAGNLYVANSAGTFNGTTVVYTGSILVFAPGATGDVAPIRTISGGSTTLGKLGGIKLDATGNIYVVSTSAMGTDPTVIKFAAGAMGNVTPASSFTSTTWTTPDNGFSLAVF